MRASIYLLCKTASYLRECIFHDVLANIGKLDARGKKLIYGIILDLFTKDVSLKTAISFISSVKKTFPIGFNVKSISNFF